jgi:hypothetical protein
VHRYSSTWFKKIREVRQAYFIQKLVKLLNIDQIRLDLTRVLQLKGWRALKFGVKLPQTAGTFDIVAISKGLRKRTLVIAIATDTHDANLAAMLLASLEPKYQKVIYLAIGDPLFVMKATDISIITDMDQLPLA